MYLHSAVDGFSRLAYTEALTDEKASTAIGFMHRARVFFAAHFRRPHQSDRHRQRLMLPRERLRQCPARRAPPANQPIHPTAQWQGRALQLRSCPRNSSTPEPGPASSSAHELSKCGTCTTTTIDLTLTPETGHPRASSTPVSPTLWPHPARGLLLCARGKGQPPCIGSCDGTIRKDLLDRCRAAGCDQTDARNRSMKDMQRHFDYS